MSFDMSGINSALGSSISNLGAEVQAKASSGQELTETDMLTLQHSMGKWTIMVNMQSNIQKTWADALKAVVQNLR